MRRTPKVSRELAGTRAAWETKTVWTFVRREVSAAVYSIVILYRYVRENRGQDVRNSCGRDIVTDVSLLIYSVLYSQRLMSRPSGSANSHKYPKSYCSIHTYLYKMIYLYLIYNLSVFWTVEFSPMLNYKLSIGHACI